MCLSDVTWEFSCELTPGYGLELKGRHFWVPYSHQQKVPWMRKLELGSPSAHMMYSLRDAGDVAQW